MKGGKPVFTLSIVAALNEKTDILQILYDRSPVGMVAAVPSMNSGNKTDDGRQLHFVGELVPYMRDTLRWTRTGTSLEGRTTRLTFEAEDGAKHSVTIELINQFILISIAPIAAIKFGGVG